MAFVTGAGFVVYCFPTGFVEQMYFPQIISGEVKVRNLSGL
jgi:hypothetical protein